MRSAWRINDYGIREAFARLEDAGLLHFLYVSDDGDARYYVFGYREHGSLPFQRMKMRAEQVRAEFLV